MYIYTNIYSFIHSFHFISKKSVSIAFKKKVQNAIIISTNYITTKNHKNSLIFNNKNSNDNNYPSISQQSKTNSPYSNKNSSNHCQISLACVPIPQHCEIKG